jgi:fluoride exporter
MRYDLVYVAVGAVIGAVLRYSVTSKGLFLGDLPLSVFVVNVIGSFILGGSMAAVQRLGLGSGFVLLVGIGFCGAFTTMSSFAFESANLIDAGRAFIAAADVILNVGVSITVIFLGRALVVALLGGV